MRKIGLAALVLTTLPVWLPSHTWAQTIPAALGGTPRDVRFLVMQTTPDGHCAVGFYHGGGRKGHGPACFLSINECLGIVGASIGTDSSGDWRCVPTGSTSTARR